jgi:hypothetical protein
MRGTLSSLIREVWFHPRLGELYPEFLFAMYGVTASSSPAMRMAADRCSARAAEDPLAAWLAEYYQEHAAEERGHEEWLLADMASLGIARERVLQRPPYVSVATLVGAQYYWMLHVHPIAYLGYIAVLEAPALLDFLEETSARTGIPLSSMTGHVMHAKLDPGHVAEFDATLDRLLLTTQHQDLITVSAIATISHLENVFVEILEHFARIDEPTSRANLFTSAIPVLK